MLGLIIATETQQVSAEFESVPFVPLLIGLGRYGVVTAVLLPLQAAYGRIFLFLFIISPVKS